MWTQDHTFLEVAYDRKGNRVDPYVQRAQKKHRAKYICAIDRQSFIVIRNKKAAKLGYLQFAIFRALHEAGPDKKMLGSELYDRLYHGSINPAIRNSIAVMCGQMNVKLKHLGLKVQGTNRRTHSFYQIVVL